MKESMEGWKDMPSEDWAEMMDLWHCHKPDTEDDDRASSVQQQQQQQQSHLRKGYGAGNRIAPTPGVGLVDITYFLLIRRECNVVIDEEPVVLKNRKSQYIINCAFCKRPVGAAEDMDSANTAKIYKWNLRFRSSPSSAWEEASVQRLVSAQLLAMIESQGIQKFVIHGQESNGDHDEQQALLIWIFTPNMFYSSTHVPDSPKQVMKIYYKPIQNPTEMIEQQSLKIDELQLPTSILRYLHSDLIASTKLLPIPARSFQDWAVGLLER
ncbi:MAG: hypothetical protein Q9224_005457 [Gallowayella concinna]